MAQSYDIYNISEEQRKNIKTNLLKTENKLIDATLNKCSQVVQLLAQALRDDALGEREHHPLAFASTIKWLQYKLDLGKDKNQKPEHNDYSFSQQQYEIANQIFAMQEEGVLDKKFNVKNFEAFKNSKLVKEFFYQGKIYNLENKINISQNFKESMQKTN